MYKTDKNSGIFLSEYLIKYAAVFVIDHRRKCLIQRLPNSLFSFMVSLGLFKHQPIGALPRMELITVKLF